MTLTEWFILLGQQLAETPPIQWLALALGVSEVLFAKANKIWLYPTGIAATALSIFILFEAGLFAECLLNLYYIVMSVYGWWYWVKKKNEPPVKITRSSRQDWITVLLIVVVGFVLLSFCLQRFTPSTVPYWDAWVSATAWAGMWLLAKRKIENWILLNLSNAFAIPLLLHKDLPLYAALTLFLFIVAVFGYIKWNKILRAEEAEQNVSFT
ncbi:nicotinamide riboside transporter PnuC [Paraflavitalea sp. CAU 1676]|uniref:nicotinamide riboside transporter PnuC n=1 Tax=Paraflavitalea sp. CAU 1676 TaxID=3032598 RepID=UPI0023DBA8F2|nr:nicotinamide riboside transporter PnuC [Paraflavitalea sp. CAU 1676]MDF2192407.1 nicotinamide riboside transporter PnuC [Paraflavitalea sp. CAU 1676]